MAPSRRVCTGRHVFRRGVWAMVAWLFADDPRGARHSARRSRRNLVFGGSPREPDHEAVIRFGGEAPRRRAHSNERFNDHVPARVTTTSDRERPARQDRSPPACRNFMFALLVNEAGQAASRSSTPCGTSPVVTMRQSAMSSLRARATIILVLCAPLTPSVRLRNHSARALSFWNSRKRQASWIRPRRTRALPDLARPFSRRLDPLSSGAPVSPA